MPEHEHIGGPKRPEYEPKTAHQRLAYLIEECGEWIADEPSRLPCSLLAALGRVLAAAGKSMRWGYASANPELPEDERITNGAWLCREIIFLRSEIAEFTMGLLQREHADRELADVRAAIARVFADVEHYPTDPREAKETLLTPTQEPIR